ncbi:MAG TPA: GDSL-type esterase/lipase family protein [Chitinophaga sp.]|uniref:GDSL-type esterase/lipase family protein n=1 Tax=Chitinophaga sp. TaxID=1869181 RepID=UPI002CF3BC2D|nr:GDSL-type esterase/lipase family protein [Chitinophaga sp.]HVI45487.1 GDSL-type esterase/lipase family protein [Chitinophaga sp.]
MITGLYNLRRRLVAGLLLLLTTIATYAQQNAVNTIQQDTALYRVFNRLSEADSNVVSILHLGDSHVQAGYFPFATGALLQQRFGSAGRGFVFPYNVAGTNGPEDYRWSSTVPWRSERLVDRYKPPVLGPGAIAINTMASAPTLAFNGKDGTEMDNNFRKVQLFYDAGIENSSVICSDAAITVTPTPFSGSPTLSMATLDFQQTNQSFQVRWEGKGSGPFRFYGAIMRNGRNGVLYHSVGINGAMYQHYNDLSNILLAQMTVLQPQLVIISLGTNEAYSRFDPLQFRDEIDKMVELIRRQQPGASILLTTPPDCMRAVRHATRKKIGKRKYKTIYTTAYYPNPYIAMVTQQIMGYARQHGIACWNFNAVNKAESGRFAGGWAGDHIHFSTRGYQLQGQLLYEALQQSYTKYLQEIKKNPVTSDDQR